MNVPYEQDVSSLFDPAGWNFFGAASDSLKWLYYWTCVIHPID